MVVDEDSPTLPLGGISLSENIYDDADLARELRLAVPAKPLTTNSSDSMTTPMLLHCGQPARTAISSEYPLMATKNLSSRPMRPPILAVLLQRQLPGIWRRDARHRHW